MGLFETKSVSRIMSESEGGTHQLKRTLGAVQLIAWESARLSARGCFLTGLAAAENSGPAVTISMIIAALGCAFAGLCYSEFSCMIPVAGSAYTYAYATLGEWIAWIIGWDLVIEYTVGSATVSISWSAYVVSLLRTFHISLPAQWIAGF
jgi:APA family basic amino acid/polyamine antiporter